MPPNYSVFEVLTVSPPSQQTSVSTSEKSQGSAIAEKEDAVYEEFSTFIESLQREGI